MSIAASVHSSPYNHWYLAAVCQFMELFSQHLSSFSQSDAPTLFEPELLLQALACQEHHETSHRSFPFHKRRKIDNTENIIDDNHVTADPPNPNHTSDRCRCDRHCCQYLSNLHIKLLLAAGYTNVKSDITMRRLYWAPSGSLCTDY